MVKLLIPLALAAIAGLAEDSRLRKAADLYERTRYEDALRVLETIPEGDTAAYALIGKCHYQLEKFNKATEIFEKAVASAPGNSEYYNWLGRAYGRRAENSSFFTAPRYASRARDYFKKAVELNPKNLEAVSDLFEYYLEAPGFLGGGLDKAAALAEQIKELDPAEYHWTQARLAEKRKDFQAAEQHFRTAVKLAPSQIGRLIDLAKFLAGQGRYQESDAIFRQAEMMAPGDPKLLFAKASVYVRARRNLDAARRLLERYLSSELTPDHPSRKEAERLLKRAESG